MSDRIIKNTNFCLYYFTDHGLKISSALLSNLRNYLDCYPIGQPCGDSLGIYLVDSCSSTLDLLPELQHRYQLASRTSLLTLSQSKSRGQLGRCWHSPPGNLYAGVYFASTDFNPKLPLSLLLGLVAVQALRMLQAPVWLKWPNDILLCNNNRWYKVGGNLIELRGKAIYWGIGINLQTAPEITDSDSLPAGLIEIVSSYGVVEIWSNFYAILLQLLQQLDLDSGLLSLPVSSLLAFRDEEIMFCQHNSADWQRGIFRGVDDDGAALISFRRMTLRLLTGSIRPCN